MSFACRQASRRNDRQSQEKYLARETSEEIQQIMETGKEKYIEQKHVEYYLGPDYSTLWEGRRRYARDYYKRTKDMFSLPDEEVSTIIESFKPDAGPDYDFRKKQYDALVEKHQNFQQKK